jgi:hypothetical protein
MLYGNAICVNFDGGLFLQRAAPAAWIFAYVNKGDASRWQYFAVFFRCYSKAISPIP